MKRLLMIMTCLLCTACTALPAEERAFAVALGVSRTEGKWTLHARIPDYQKPGGYRTVSGTGTSLEEAMAVLDASAPMQLHLGQLRLLVMEQSLAGTEGIAQTLSVLSARPDIRQEAHAAVTSEPMYRLMEAMNPAAGTRLSKSLDVMLNTRFGEGTAIPAALGDTLRMGVRQTPVMLNLSLDGEAMALSGAWPADGAGVVHDRLSPEETQLLSMMLGRMHTGTLILPEGAMRLIGVKVERELTEPLLDSASVRLILRGTGSGVPREELSASVAKSCLALLNRLSAAGCDVLGLGREAMTYVQSMADWQEMNWPQRLLGMAWSVSVGVE